MSINKNHKDYPEYMRRWNERVERFKCEEEAIEKELADFRGPVSLYTDPLRREFYKDLKELQREYEHLFDELIWK